LPNFVFLVIDSLSTNGLKQYCPRLKSWLDNLDSRKDLNYSSYAFPKYHPFFGGTSANMAALFLGQHLHATLAFEERAANASRWLWTWLQTRGYVSAFVPEPNKMWLSPYSDLAHIAKEFDHIAPVLSAFVTWGDDLSLNMECRRGGNRHPSRWEYIRQLLEKYGEQGVPIVTYTHLFALHGGRYENCFIYEDIPDKLEALMRQSDDTIIFLMGDHGGQGRSGDMLIDHLSNAVNILVPDALQASWGNVAVNQVHPANAARTSR
jgi:hypothetical protein